MKKASKAVLKTFANWHNDLARKLALLEALIRATGFEEGKDYELERIEEKGINLPFSWLKMVPKEEEAEK